MISHVKLAANDSTKFSSSCSPSLAPSEAAPLGWPLGRRGFLGCQSSAANHLSVHKTSNTIMNIWVLVYVLEGQVSLLSLLCFFCCLRSSHRTLHGICATPVKIHNPSDITLQGFPLKQQSGSTLNYKATLLKGHLLGGSGHVEG